MKNPSKQIRGSVLVVTVMFTMVIATVTASFLHLALSESRLSNSIMYSNNSMNLSEAGVERALNALNHLDWDDWEVVAPDLTILDDPPDQIDLGGGMTGQMRVHIIGDDMTPTVIAEGVMMMPNRPDVSRQIEVRLERRRYFANGITSLNRIKFSGGNSEVDSYRSSLDYGYNETVGGVTNRFDNGSAASNSIEADAMDLSNGEIFGYAATGSRDGLKLGPKGKVYGEDDSGHSPHRVAYDYYGEFPPITAPDYPWEYGVPDSDGNTQTTLTGTGVFGDSSSPEEPKYYKLDAIDIQGGGHELQIVGHSVVYVTGDIRIDGNASFDIAEGASLKIFVDGDVDISGSGSSSAEKPEDFVLFGTSDTTQNIELGGNASWTAAVYAPNANVHLNGGGGASDWFGAVVGRNVDVTGNYRFHYDEDLADFRPEEATFRMDRWRELHAAGERYDFAINDDTESREIWWILDL